MGERRDQRDDVGERTLILVGLLDRKVGQVLFHPTAEGVLASASGDHIVSPHLNNNTITTPTITVARERERRLNLIFPLLVTRSDYGISTMKNLQRFN